MAGNVSSGSGIGKGKTNKPSQDSGNITNRGPIQIGGDKKIAPGGVGEFKKTLAKLQGGLSVQKGLNNGFVQGKD